MVAIKILIPLLFLSNIAISEQHPRIILDRDKINEVRRSILNPESHNRKGYEMLKAKVDENNYKLFNYYEKNYNYNRSYLAHAAAFMYQLTEDTKYAEIAFEQIEDIFKEPDPQRRTSFSEIIPTKLIEGERYLDKNVGLSRSTIGMSIAFAYDWCYNGWSEEQRAYVEEKIIKSLDTWKEYNHIMIDQEEDASNWVAVCRSGELIQMLVLYQEEKQADRYAFLKEKLKNHIQNAYSDLGYTQEGIGYAAYGGIFLLPAVYALQSIGDNDLIPAFESKPFWKWAMYSGSFFSDSVAHRRVFLPSGVSRFSINDDGWVSLLLNSVPEPYRPYYLWFYDRHMGRLGNNERYYLFDNNRAGLVWSILYYPINVRAQNPSLNPEFTAVCDQESGACYFRNKWMDEDDIQVSIFADAHYAGRSWDQAEAFQISLNAFGNQFITGPSKSTKVYSYSTLLVDGINHSTRKRERNRLRKHGRNDTGELLAFEPTKDGGGRVVIGGAKNITILEQRLPVL